MKSIFLLTDSYYPEPTAAAKLLKDLTDKLLIKNKITVLSAANKTNFMFKKNINIYSVKIPFIRSKNLFLKFLSELSMPIILYFHFFLKINKTFDVLLCYSPSIFFVYFIKKTKKFFINSKKILILRDIFPDWTIQAKILHKKSLKYKYLKKVQRDLFELFDHIGVQAKTDINFIEKRFKKKCFGLYNWIKKQSNQKKNYSKLNKKFIFIGNLGLAQDTEFLTKIIKIISRKPEVTLTILGSGRGQKRIYMNNFKQFNNINFLNKVKQSKLKKIIKKYDFGIISLKKEIEYNNFPGKFLMYLINNMAVFCYSSSKIELFKMIKKYEVGIAISSKNTKIIENKLKILINYNNNDFKFVKKNTNKLYNTFFRPDIALKKLENLIDGN